MFTRASSTQGLRCGVAPPCALILSEESEGQMQWSDLNSEQQHLLTAWYMLADASPPEHGEELPLEAAQALHYLAVATGKAQRSRFEKLPRRGSAPGYHATPNRKRIVRRRKATGQLAS